MAEKQITTVYCGQQASYPVTTSAIFCEAMGMEISVPVMLSFDCWPRIRPCGINADEVAILSGWPVQPIAQA